MTKTSPMGTFIVFKMEYIIVDIGTKGCTLGYCTGEARRGTGSTCSTAVYGSIHILRFSNTAVLLRYCCDDVATASRIQTLERKA